jgi:seryl-tRNA synthetase
MLEVAKIRESREEIIERLTVRGIDAKDTVDKILEIDQHKRKTQAELDTQLAEMNKLSKQIGELYKSGKAEEANTIKAQTGDLKESTHRLKEEMGKAEEELKALLYQLPNVPHPSVPRGKNEEDNDIVHEEGTIPTLHEGAVPHWELIEKYDIIDFKAGVKITGAGFPVYKGKGAKLQRALINFFLDEATAAGFQEIIPPLMINEDSGYGTGQLPDKEGQMYHMEREDFYMIPTAEVPITNMYRDVLLNEKDFPIKMTGYTPCFRREAGAWGSHVRGLNRLHQFDKVEIVQIEHPDKSYETLDAMVEHVKGLLQKLGLPFRIARLCGGDLGFTSALTFDMEVFSAAQQKWLEVSSISNFETFQANRLKLRFKGENGKQLAHTLNGSALALPRIVAALLENNQTPDGIKVPEVLLPYAGFDLLN